MRVTVEQYVAAPREVVFDLMADSRHEDAWNSQVTETELLTGEPIGEGTEFRTVNRGNEFIARITHHERPKRLVFEVTGKPLRIVGGMDFADEGEGTKLTGEFDFQGQNFMYRAMMPLMGPAVRKDFPKQFASFAKFCESR